MGNDSIEGLFPGGVLQVTSGNVKEKHTRKFVSYLLRRKINGEI